MLLPHCWIDLKRDDVLMLCSLLFKQVDKHTAGLSINLMINKARLI